ncbi:sulfate transporter [Parafrankia colletiae]|uniref:Sulfate transporter n=1 Tax=Parafrankia colletiae TaxID=573497 RepID=A0A1S1R4L2_9ACTN|nr:sulfate permease [Parafrankia colletiae]MCK9901568.1 sulfate permease [Frankia sp. Cpl3]OHV41110.1 sulfate transporter [Parafrankia colletiae]
MYHLRLPPLPRYSRRWVRGDVASGLTVAAYLIPQVMAYGALAGVAPVAGLWAIAPAIVAYAVLGSSRLLSVGPESTTALMTAAAVAPLAAGDPNRHATLAATLAVGVGVLAIAAGIARLGVIAHLLSRPILVGYLAGVAVIMIVGQLEKVTGVPVDSGSLYGELRSFAGSLHHLHLGTLAVSVASLALLVALHRWTPRLPSPLIVIMIATFAVWVFGLDGHGVRVVGAVEGGLPRLVLPTGSDLVDLAPSALGILFVGFADNMLTARAFGGRDSHRIDANRELFALGTANLGAGAGQGFPVSSSGSRTALAASSGAHTQVYSLVALVAVVLVLAFGRPALAMFPRATLGAIIIFAAVRLIDVAGFRRLASFRRSELALALTAAGGVLVFDILYGVLVAIGVSLLDLLARVARPHDAVLGQVPGLDGMHDVDDYPSALTVPGLFAYRYDSPLFFANAENFRRRALAALDACTDDVDWFVLNMEAIVEVDITALDALEDLRAEVTGRGIAFGLAHVKHDLLDDLTAYGLTAKVQPEMIFPTMRAATAAHRLRSQDRHP